MRVTNLDIILELYKEDLKMREEILKNIDKNYLYKFHFNNLATKITSGSIIDFLGIGGLFLVKSVEKIRLYYINFLPGLNFLQDLIFFKKGST